jgi:hypothetical protein
MEGAPQDGFHSQNAVPGRGTKYDSREVTRFFEIAAVHRKFSSSFYAVLDSTCC